VACVVVGRARPLRAVALDVATVTEFAEAVTLTGATAAVVTEVAGSADDEAAAAPVGEVPGVQPHSSGVELERSAVTEDVLEVHRHSSRLAVDRSSRSDAVPGSQLPQSELDLDAESPEVPGMHA